MGESTDPPSTKYLTLNSQWSTSDAAEVVGEVVSGEVVEVVAFVFVAGGFEDDLDDFSLASSSSPARSCLVVSRRV